MRSMLVLAATFGLAACDDGVLTEDELPAAAAVAMCDYFEACGVLPGMADFEYDRCIPSATGSWEFELSAARNAQATYDPELGAACVAAWERETETCDMEGYEPDACFSVWVD